ncbi:hypothetical protein IAR55_004896 [Kwoniella newhampshirensis]|uniref:Uncharacterized protein n=1 Tax=Kwoniella newhampshirensis TaxID=1651941 RepID=A0AAW0YM61_9TREE
MDHLSSIIDITFLLFALFVIPHAAALPFSSTGGADTNTDTDTGLTSHPTCPLPTPGTQPSPSAHLSAPTLVPNITITPSHIPPSPSSIQQDHQRAIFQPRPRPAPFRTLGPHRRKIVSFSLSSIDDILSPSAMGDGKKRRPPTPFIRPESLASPLIETTPSPSPGPHPSQSQGQGHGSPLTSPAQSTGSMEMSHRPNEEDTMGVKRKWLMA